MQYHYTMWPDHGTPDSLCLVVFHSHVLRTRSEKPKTPIVVHCSAGIGRTGTYIALDALYKTGKTSGYINVVEYVKAMRSSRMNMVQTYEQYQPIYSALSEEFKATTETQSLIDFMGKVDNSTGIHPTFETVISKEFQTLLQKRPDITNRDAKDYKLQETNNEETWTPPKQMDAQPTKRRGFSSPNFAASYKRPEAFIVTKYPTQEDAVDFLRLLIDNKSETVISMDPLKEIESIANCKITWFPATLSSKTVGPYVVEQGENSGKDVRITNFQNVAFVEPKEPLVSGGHLKDASCLLSLVTFALTISTSGPITIVGKDGGSLCGVFCAVFNSVQQIRMDDSVDVFTTVRLLQIKRPEFCSSLRTSIYLCTEL